MTCVFCKIAKKELPSEIIYEDNEVAVFKDIKPSAPIHCLVVPKKHIKSIANLKDSHREIIFKMIFTAKKIAKDLGLKGYRLAFNVGREGGQIVDHLHLHILGGWKK